MRSFYFAFISTASVAICMRLARNRAEESPRGFIRNERDQCLLNAS